METVLLIFVILFIIIVLTVFTVILIALIIGAKSEHNIENIINEEISIIPDQHIELPNEEDSSYMLFMH